MDVADAEPHLVEAVRNAWKDAETDVRDDSESTVVDVLDLTPETLAERQSELSVHVTLAALDAQRGEKLLFHAGGLALPDGRVIALVGPSGRGKTTASRTLGSRLGYVSDETVAVGFDGTVHPYRKPLSLIVPGAELKVQLAPTDVGLMPLPPHPLRLSGLVLLDRRPESTAPTVRALPLATAITELVPQLSYLNDVDRPLQTLARCIDAVGGVSVVDYGEAEQLWDVLDELTGTAAARPTWRALPIGETPSAGEVGHGDIQDAIETDDETIIVMSDGIVQVLDGIAPTLWRATARPLPMSELVQEVIARHGSPPQDDAAAQVSEAVTRLCRSEVLQTP